MNSMRKALLIAITIIAAFSVNGCGDLLSTPPANVVVSLASDPVSVPSFSGAAISWTTNVECLHAIEYGTAAGTYTEATPKNAAASAQHGVALSGLAPSTQYFYRVVSYYEGIRPFNSAEYAFTTSAAPASPADSLAISATPASAPTYYNATVDFTTNASATYILEYGTASATYGKATLRSSTAATAHSVTLADLASATTYYYRIALYYEGAFAKNSAEYSFTTLPDPVAAMAIDGTPVSAPTFNGATITFATTRAGTYALEYGTVSLTYTKATPRTGVVATFHSATLSSLVPGTRYYYRMGLYLAGVFVSNSAEYFFDTAADPNVLTIDSGPTVIPALTSLQIDWTSNIGCTHILEYDTNSGVPYAFSKVSTAISTAHSETIPGLPSGTTYYYRIRLLWDTGADFTSGEFITATAAETAPTAAQKARGIWVIGGLSGPLVTSTVSAIDLYDPALNTWYPAAASTTGYVPVSFAAYAAINGKLYVFGGYDATGTVQSLVQIYTIATNSWTTGTSLPAVRANAFASVLNGRIYILGGTALNSTVAYAGTATTYEYNVALNSWQMVPVKVSFGAAGSERFSYGYDGTVYNMGGRTTATAVALTHDGIVQSTTANPLAGELDNPGTVELPMTAVRGGFSGGVFKPATTPAFVYIIGGVAVYTGTTGGFVNFPLTASAAPLNTVQFLHYPFTAPRAWQTPTNQYPSVIAHGATVVSTAVVPERIFHFGGTVAFGAGAAGSVVGYSIPIPPDPQLSTIWSDSWTLLPNMSPGRWGHGAVTLNQ